MLASPRSLLSRACVRACVFARAEGRDSTQFRANALTHTTHTTHTIQTPRSTRSENHSHVVRALSVCSRARPSRLASRSPSTRRTGVAAVCSSGFRRVEVLALCSANRSNSETRVRVRACSCSHQPCACVSLASLRVRANLECAVREKCVCSRPAPAQIIGIIVYRCVRGGATKIYTATHMCMCAPRSLLIVVFMIVFVTRCARSCVSSRQSCVSASAFEYSHLMRNFCAFCICA